MRRIIFFFSMLLVVYILNAFVFPIPSSSSPLGPRPKMGVSYSFEQALWYELDKRAGFTKLASSGQFDWIRVPFFWDQMTDSLGNLKIDDLIFAAQEADKYNVKLVVALGAKTPYYPEYHLPLSLDSKVKFGDVIGANHPIAGDILAIDKKVVDALWAYPAVSYWQVENEPFLANFGNLKIGFDLLAAEVQTVRNADPLRRPIILNSAGSAIFAKDDVQLTKLLAPGDVFAINAYFKTQGTNLFSFKLADRIFKIPWPRFLVWPVQSWLFLSPDIEKMRETVEKNGLEFWVMEAQGEPYIRTLSDAKGQNFSFRAEDIPKVVNFLSGSQVRSIGFWGANFWLFRESLGDRTWLDSVSKVNY